MLSAASAVLYLALAIFNESRSEAIPGQRAVAEVVLNRTASACYPDNTKDVIFQRSQFSWARDVQLKRPALAVKNDADSWNKAYRIATEAYIRHLLGDRKSIGTATHFYSGAMPAWAKGYRSTKIGNHHFLTIPCKGESYVR